MTPAELLNIAAWAAQLSAAELEHAARGVVIRSFSRGAYICHRGDRLDYWTGVITGICKISTVSPQGKAISYSGVPAGGWFGEGSIIKNEPRKYDIVAVRDSEVAFMTGGTFRWLFENSTGFNRFLVMQLNERLGQFIGMVGYDRMLDASGRLARTIAWLFNPVLFPGTREELEIDQQELAELCGLSRQATNKALQALCEEGLISCNAGRLRIRDFEALSHYGE